jgi:hypothetical protein
MALDNGIFPANLRLQLAIESYNEFQLFTDDDCEGMELGACFGFIEEGKVLLFSSLKSVVFESF